MNPHPFRPSIWVLLLTEMLWMGWLPPLFAQPETEKICYKVIGGDSLFLHLISPADKKKQPSPAILYFFGGGWKGGTVEQFRPHATYFAGRGLSGILVEYRVSNQHGTTPFDAVEDAKSAMRYVRSHAQQLGVDPGRLAAAGGSAGGHLAVATATLPGLDAESDDLQVPTRPDALILFNPVYDNGPEGYGYERIGERYPEISPIHNVRPGIPPVVVFLGTEDALIPVSTARTFHQKVQEAGGNSLLYLYPGQKHGFFNYRARPYFNETVRQADQFLQGLGWISGPASIPPEADVVWIKEE